MRKRLIAALATVAVVAVAVGAYLVLQGREPRRAIRTFSRVPNIVLINTDDMRLDSLSAMPIVRRLLVDHGVTFTNAFVTTSLCCPSRASMLTGTYAHTHGVWGNAPPLGGFSGFHDHSTIATWLHAAGYRTGLFGKYLNKYENTRYIPPGWDRWVAWDGGRCNCNFYYNYWLNRDGMRCLAEDRARIERQFAQRGIARVELMSTHVVRARRGQATLANGDVPEQRPGDEAVRSRTSLPPTPPTTTRPTSPTSPRGYATSRPSIPPGTFAWSGPGSGL